MYIHEHAVLVPLVKMRVLLVKHSLTCARSRKAGTKKKAGRECGKTLQARANLTRRCGKTAWKTSFLDL